MFRGNYCTRDQGIHVVSRSIKTVERRQITPRIFSISSRRRSPLGELTGGTGEGRSVGARGLDCTGEKPCSRSNRKIQERIHQEVPSFFFLILYRRCCSRGANEWVILYTYTVAIEGDE